MQQNNKSNQNKCESSMSSQLVKSLVQSAAMIIGIIVTLTVAYLLFLPLVQSGAWINIVAGNSMDPTLQDGQVIFSDFGDVSRGDVVTLIVPENNQAGDWTAGQVLVKRVIGMPGEIVALTPTAVYINNEVLVENYLTDSAIKETYQDGQLNLIVLGDDEYFVMGDNRADSYDSRSFGAIKAEDICYIQSDKPTFRFYVTLVIGVLLFVVACVIYILVETGITQLAYSVIRLNQGKQKQTQELDGDVNRDLVDDLKGEVE